MVPPHQASDDQVDFHEVSFDKLMGELHKIKGYRAAAIMTYDGELLYSDGTEGSKTNNLSVIMEALNEFFGLASILTEMKEFDSCAGVSLRVGDEIMVIRFSGEDSRVGIRLVVCIEEHGNVALLQRRLERLLPRIIKCLAWEPDNQAPLYMKERNGGYEGMHQSNVESVKMTMN